MRKLIIKMSEKDHHDFLNMANEYGLTVEEKIHEVINYYLLIERRKFKTCRFPMDST